MKKVHFGVSAYWKPTPTGIRKAVGSMQTLFGVLAASSYAQQKPTFAFWMLVAAGAVQFVGNLFGFIEDVESDDKTPLV